VQGTTGIVAELVNECVVLTIPYPER